MTGWSLTRRIAAAVLFTCALIGGAGDAGMAAERKLLIVVIDRVTWDDLLAEEAQATTLRRLATEGAPGMMCVRAARGFGGEHATIGAGARAASRMNPATRASVEADAFNATERVDGASAAEVFTARTGYPVGGNAIVHLGLGELIHQNEGAPYRLQLGLLGGTLARTGLRAACIGNADTSTARHREAVAIIMDERGLVPLGVVAGPLTRTQRLTSVLRQLSAVSDVIVLDAGETARVEAQAEFMTPAALSAARRRAIHETDRLLADVLAVLPQPTWSVLVLTPSLRSAQREESFAALAPVIWWPAPPGRQLLTSPSTRRPGLVVNTDVAPSVLSYFGVPTPEQMVGRPFDFGPADGSALERLRVDLARQNALETTRPQLTRAVAVLATAALWLAALLLLIGDRVPDGLRTLARGLLLLVLAAPPAMLVVAQRPQPASVMMAAAAGGAVGVALLGGWLGRWRAGYVPPCLLLVALLVYDLISGQQMLWWSPLSYSAAAGARFYGVGNEYGGALLGAAIITAAALLGENAPAPARALFGGICLGLAVLVGLPGYGANLGMALASAVAAVIFCLYLFRRRPGWRDAVGAVVLGLALVGAAMAVEYLRNGGETSHIGRWITSLRREGWEAAFSVASRKLDMNLLLVRTSLWSDVAFGALVLLAVAAAARPAGLFAALRERFWLTPAVISGSAGALAAFALNDSGVVAAAMVLLYTVGPLAYVSLETPAGRR